MKAIWVIFILVIIVFTGCDGPKAEKVNQSRSKSSETEFNRVASQLSEYIRNGDLDGAKEFATRLEPGSLKANALLVY